MPLVRQGLCETRALEPRTPSCVRSAKSARGTAMALSLVLPCYNEERNVGATIADALAWMRERSIEGELIAVDDGSTDGTAERLERLARIHPELRVVTHERNRGYGDAVASGCDAARCELVAFMDSDGQFRVEDLALLLDQAEEHLFVAGRRLRRADPPMRNVLGKILAVANLCCFRLWIRDVNCGMKVFHRSVWRSIRPPDGLEKFFNAMLFFGLRREGIEWCQIAVPHYPRVHGNQTGAKWSVITKMLRELSTIRVWQRARTEFAPRTVELRPEPPHALRRLG
jgi:glycosyltransferase involved in cell wall biosynthesis